MALAKVLFGPIAAFVGCSDEWCEANGVKYSSDWRKTGRLLKRITHTMKKARRDWAYSGRGRRFIHFFTERATVVARSTCCG